MKNRKINQISRQKEKWMERIIWITRGTYKILE